VGHEEYEDIRTTGRFRTVEGMMEGKWFADTYKGVLLHAAGLYPDGDYHVVAADVPASMLEQLYKLGNLDQFGPATYLESGDLAMISPILEVHNHD